MGKLKKYKGTAIWFLLCNVALILSTFLHEVGHGFSSWMNGFAVSTGFNRVGNAYKYPRDIDFRAGFTGGEILKDIGPAVTLLLALLFTIVFLKKRYANTILDRCILALAISNSIMRLVPAVTVLLRILITGEGTEDEIQQGMAWAERLNLPILTYLFALLSIVVSLICLILLYTHFKKLRREKIAIPNPSWVWPAYITSFFILNVLDMYIRINWV